jgi:hypothetical protein
MYYLVERLICTHTLTNNKGHSYRQLLFGERTPAILEVPSTVAFWSHCTRQTYRFKALASPPFLLFQIYPTVRDLPISLLF